MFRKQGKRLVSVALTSALAVGAFATPFSTSLVKAESDNIKVQLIGLNDLHGNLDTASSLDYDKDGEEESVGGLDYLASKIKGKRAEQPNTLLVNAGDMIGASPLLSAAFHDEPTIEALNELQYDVGVLGNHEFDEGIAELKRIVYGGEHEDGTSIEGYDGADFDILSANMVDDSTGELIMKPYTVKEVDGAKIGFIGITTTETPNMIVQTGNENLRVIDETEAINKYTNELKEQGVKAIVVLAHNQVFADESEDTESSSDLANIAQNIDDEVDVIFGGHNQIIVNRTIDNKLIVQSGEYGKAYSDVDIEIDPETGDIVKKEAVIEYNDRNEGTQDQSMKELIDRFKELVEPIENEVVGEAATAIEGGYAGRGPVGDNALGNLIADSMKAAGDADIAMMNGGGIRADLDAGDITYGELFKVQPFNNLLVKFELTGEELKQAMNRQFSSYGPDYSIAGFQYTWNYEDQAIVDIKGENGEPLDLDKTYSVVVNNYMFGDPDMAFSDFYEGKGENIALDIDAFEDYVRAQEGAITYEAEGRIVEVDAEGEVALPFVDVDTDDWAYDFIQDLYNRDVLNGTTDTVFSPDRDMTRAEFTTMLVRGLDLTGEVKNLPFEDLQDASSEVRTAVAAAYDNGIVQGVSENTFNGTASITRVEMTVMAMRAYELLTGEAYVAEGEATFEDIGALRVESAASVHGAYELGLVDGFTDTEFKPYEKASRAQLAKVFSLFLSVTE